MGQIKPGNMYFRLLRYLKNYRSEFIGAALCMILFGASDGGVPFIIKYALDGVFSNQDKELLAILPIALILFAVVRALCDFGQQYLMAKVGHNIVRDIRNDINSHLLKLDPLYFVRQSSANLLSRVTSDVILVRSLLTDSVAAITRDVIRVIALLISAIYLDPILAAIAFIAFPIGIYPVYRFGRRVKSLSRRGQDKIGSLSSRLQESILGNRVVKIFGREPFEDHRFRTENDELTKTFVRSERVRALSGPVNEVLASIAISLVILYGGYSVIGGQRTQGEFIAFLIAVFLLYDPFKKLSRVHAQVQQGMSGAERIMEVLDTPVTIKDPESPVPLPSSNSIEFDNVTFSYDQNDSASLSGIDLVIPEGSKFAIVGFSGAGKSTLVDLLPRFIVPSHGVIRIGEVDIARLALRDLRSKIAMVGQHTFLFNDTVFNNIAYGFDQASPDKVIVAAQAAYAHDFVMNLPHGYETMVGEGGLSLSGGERQRIAIARAILKDAPILILDEATASLDNKSEREVQSALEALEKNRTTLVIAHRLSTVLNADKIVVLSQGLIVEQGTHTQLLSLGGEYAKLHALQFSDPKDKSDLDEVSIN